MMMVAQINFKVCEHAKSIYNAKPKNFKFTPM